MCDNPSINGFGEDFTCPEPTDKITMLYTDDPKANFICGSKGYEEDIKVQQPYDKDLVDISKYDYMIDDEPTENTDTTEDKRKTISYMSVNSIEEGIEWYKTQYPKIPDDLYPIMARWNWGDLGTLTKKDVKNDIKRLKKGQKPKNMCLEVKTGTFKVDFD